MIQINKVVSSFSNPILYHKQPCDADVREEAKYYSQLIKKPR